MPILDMIQRSTVQSEASLEYRIGAAAKLTAGDTAKDFATLHSMHAELKEKQAEVDQLEHEVAEKSSHGLFGKVAEFIGVADAGSNGGGDPHHGPLELSFVADPSHHWPW